MDSKYQFVGGPLDGHEVLVSDPVSLGIELPMPVMGENRTAVYAFHDDSRFHFERYGPQSLLSMTMTADQNRELMATMKRLSAVLKELDDLYLGLGGYPSQFHVDGWVLRKN